MKGGWVGECGDKPPESNQIGAKNASLFSGKNAPVAGNARLHRLGNAPGAASGSISAGGPPGGAGDGSLPAARNTPGFRSGPISGIKKAPGAHNGPISGKKGASERRDSVPECGGRGARRKPAPPTPLSAAPTANKNPETPKAASQATIDCADTILRQTSTKAPRPVTTPLVLPRPALRPERCRRCQGGPWHLCHRIASLRSPLRGSLRLAISAALRFQDAPRVS